MIDRSTNLLRCCLLSISLLCIGAFASHAQRRNVALDSMGINIGRQDWKAAMHWALKAAEADPAEKYWRYLNAADFASRDGNREAAIRYAALVVDSDIAANARFGPSFAWLQDDPAWQQLMHKVAGIREAARQAKIKASLVFRDEP